MQFRRMVWKRCVETECVKSVGGRQSGGQLGFSSDFGRSFIDESWHSGWGHIVSTFSAMLRN